MAHLTLNARKRRVGARVASGEGEARRQHCRPRYAALSCGSQCSPMAGGKGEPIYVSVSAIGIQSLTLSLRRPTKLTSGATPSPPDSG